MAPTPLDIVIEKHWDGNECITEYGNRTYVSNGRWQWIVIVNGESDSAHNLRREARFRADQIRAEHARPATARKGTR